VVFAKGVATGFVMGVALIGTAIATLYVHDDSVHERSEARIDQLDAQVRQLELAVSRLAGRVAEESRVPAVATATPASLTTEQVPPR
jgi:hypothetical protein